MTPRTRETHECPVTEADIRFIRNCGVLLRVLQQKAPEMRCGHMEGQAIELAEKLDEMREEAHKHGEW